MHDIRTDFFEVLEEISRSSRPFISVAFIIGDDMGSRNSAENKVSTAGPTAELFTNTTELRRSCKQESKLSSMIFSIDLTWKERWVSISWILIIGVLDWAVLLAKLVKYAMVICQMILFLSTGLSIRRERSGGEC
jgi:hypothetical protein